MRGWKSVLGGNENAKSESKDAHPVSTQAHETAKSGTRYEWMNEMPTISTWAPRRFFESPRINTLDRRTRETTLNVEWEKLLFLLLHRDNLLLPSVFISCEILRLWSKYINNPSTHTGPMAIFKSRALWESFQASTIKFKLINLLKTTWAIALLLCFKCGLEGWKFLFVDTNDVSLLVMITRSHRTAGSRRCWRCFN